MLSQLLTIYTTWIEAVADVSELHTATTFRIEKFGGRVLFWINQTTEQNSTLNMKAVSIYKTSETLPIITR
jgi:hypothetical protein